MGVGVHGSPWESVSACHGEPPRLGSSLEVEHVDCCEPTRGARVITLAAADSQLPGVTAGLASLEALAKEGRPSDPQLARELARAGASLIERLRHPASALSVIEVLRAHVGDALTAPMQAALLDALTPLLMIGTHEGHRAPAAAVAMHADVARLGELARTLTGSDEVLRAAREGVLLRVLQHAVASGVAANVRAAVAPLDLDSDRIAEGLVALATTATHLPGLLPAFEVARAHLEAHGPRALALRVSAELDGTRAQRDAEQARVDARDAMAHPDTQRILALFEGTTLGEAVPDTRPVVRALDALGFHVRFDAEGAFDSTGEHARLVQRVLEVAGRSLPLEDRREAGRLVIASDEGSWSIAEEAPDAWANLPLVTTVALALLPPTFTLLELPTDTQEHAYVVVPTEHLARLMKDPAFAKLRPKRAKGSRAVRSEPRLAAR